MNNDKTSKTQKATGIAMGTAGGGAMGAGLGATAKHVSNKKLPKLPFKSSAVGVIKHSNKAANINNYGKKGLVVGASVGLATMSALALAKHRSSKKKD
jgi:hypothetical protein